jgi:hypothetical protein
MNKPNQISLADFDQSGLRQATSKADASELLFKLVATDAQFDAID